MATHEDYYTTLEVDRTASFKDIKKAYHRLSLKYHPDKNKGSDSVEDYADKFVEIGLAYEVLSDKDRRSEYDGDISAVPSNRDKKNPFDSFKDFACNSQKNTVASSEKVSADSKYFIFRNSNDFTKEEVKTCKLLAPGFKSCFTKYNSFGTKIINSLDRESCALEIESILTEGESDRLYIKKLSNIKIEELETEQFPIYCNDPIADDLFKDSEVITSYKKVNSMSASLQEIEYSNYCASLDELLPTESLLMYQCIEE